MTEPLPIERMTSAQLWVLGRLIHLRSEDWGTPYLPRWVIEAPLAEAPFNLNRDGYVGVIQSLLDSGWVLRPQPAEGQTWSDVEVEFMASDEAMAERDTIAEGLRNAFPDVPGDLPEMLLLVDAVLNPAGFESGTIWTALEGPPANLPEGEAIERYRRLLAGGWLNSPTIEGRSQEWFPGAHAWAWSEHLAQQLQDHSQALRDGLARGVADRLELEVGDPVRRALDVVDRAHFVDEDGGWWSYLDRPLTVVEDSAGNVVANTSSPSVCAIIAKTLEIEDGDRILVCGVKGGYTAALSAVIAGPRTRVVCLETNQAVVDHARSSVTRAGLDRRIEIRLVHDVTLGTDEGGPWDAIVLNGQVPKVPRPLVKQLAERGRLLIFLQEGGEAAQVAYLIRKHETAVKHERLSSFQFTPIFGQYGYDPPNWQEKLHLVGGEVGDIFVSYSSRDEEECRGIVRELEMSGMRCWFSGRDHPVGRDGYETAIMDALKRASLFVVILSHDSIASDHVHNELTNGTHHGKAMLPIRLPACPRTLPARFGYHLQRFQQYDLHDHPVSVVVEAAASLLGVSPKRPQAMGGRSQKRVMTPSSQNGFESRSASLWNVVLADGRISRDEMALLVQLARNKDPNLSEGGARARVEQQARRLLPSVVIDA